MADTLISGTTLIEKETRSIGDITIGGIIEWDDTFSNLPDGFVECDGATITDPISSYNGSAVPNLNTNYWTSPACNFISENPDTDQVLINSNFKAETDGIVAFCPVFLPHGATITEVIVYGNAAATAETWDLRYTSFAGSQSSMATANIGTADTTISSAVIDNTIRSYILFTSSIDTNDIIYGAKITYTPRQKFIIRIK